MAEEGATFYYSSKQDFDFDKSYDYLRNSGLTLKHTDANFIILPGANSEYTEKEIKNIKDIIYKDKNSGMYLFLDSGIHTFWSFVEGNNYFFEHFTFNYIGCLEVEERLCEIFTSFAIERIAEIGTQFLGFTLDMYGETEAYDFEEIFDNTNKNTLNQSYISDLTFIHQEKMSQFDLDEKVEIITLNHDFICIAKNKALAKYLKGLLPINWVGLKIIN